jgi:hypothetical protein
LQVPQPFFDLWWNRLFFSCPVPLPLAFSLCTSSRSVLVVSIFFICWRDSTLDAKMNGPNLVPGTNTLARCRRFSDWGEVCDGMNEDSGTTARSSSNFGFQLPLLHYCLAGLRVTYQSWVVVNWGPRSNVLPCGPLGVQRSF